MSDGEWGMTGVFADRREAEKQRKASIADSTGMDYKDPCLIS